MRFMIFQPLAIMCMYWCALELENERLTIWIVANKGNILIHTQFTSHIVVDYTRITHTCICALSVYVCLHTEKRGKKLKLQFPSIVRLLQFEHFCDCWLVLKPPLAKVISRYFCDLPRFISNLLRISIFQRQTHWKFYFYLA